MKYGFHTCVFRDGFCLLWYFEKNARRNQERNQIRDMIGGKIGKFTFGRNEYTFRFEPKEYRPVYEILVHWGGCGPKRFLMFCWPCISV